MPAPDVSGSGPDDDVDVVEPDEILPAEGDTAGHVLFRAAHGNYERSRRRVWQMTESGGSAWQKVALTAVAVSLTLIITFLMLLFMVLFLVVFTVAMLVIIPLRLLRGGGR